MAIDTTSSPAHAGDYDIYVFGTDFDGVPLGLSLARTLRHDRPKALIIATSDNYDGDLLKALLNAGCNGACDKGSPDDLDTLLELVGAHVEKIGGRRDGITGVLRSMTNLLREWNQPFDRRSV